MIPVRSAECGMRNGSNAECGMVRDFLVDTVGQPVETVDEGGTHDASEV